MSVSSVLIAIGLACAIVGGVGLLIGVLLGWAGRFFAVKTDEREEAVRAALPGNNCGGCGFAGCDAVAAAIVKGEAPVNACPVGGNDAAQAIASIMGVEAETSQRKVAYVHCSGTCDKAVATSHYFGAKDCRQAAIVPGHGGKGCSFGCFGLGSCANVCEEGGITIKDGVAVIDRSSCIACGRCVAICPQHLISLIPATQTVEVTCSSTASGKAVKAVCAAGCIGCGICQKSCPSEAIHVENNLARVNPDLCTGCGTCAAKCPVKVIHIL